MLLDIVLDALEILGFLTLFLTLAALIMAPGGPKGIMKLIRDPPVIPVIGFSRRSSLSLGAHEYIEYVNVKVYFETRERRKERTRGYPHT